MAMLPLTAIADPNIEIFSGRADYEAKKGRTAPPPNTFYPQQYWADKRTGLTGRVRYDWVLDTTDTNALKLHPVEAVETDPVRLKFYKDYKITEVPKIVPGVQMFASFVVTPNFPKDKPGEYNDPLWSSLASTIHPVRPLKPNEAFYPRGLDHTAIVNMDEFRAIQPITNQGATSTTISETSPAIQESLSQILAGIRTVIQLLQTK